MELLIGAAYLLMSFGFGYLAGMLTFGRHVERECERAYLYGHVDGYAKAVRDEL